MTPITTIDRWIIPEPNNRSVAKNDLLPFDLQEGFESLQEKVKTKPKDALAELREADKVLEQIAGFLATLYHTLEFRPITPAQRAETIESFVEGYAKPMISLWRDRVKLLSDLVTAQAKFEDEETAQEIQAGIEYLNEGLSALSEAINHLQNAGTFEEVIFHRWDGTEVKVR